MSDDILSLAAPYIGLPFKRGGRDRTGLDCWGLVRMVLQDRKGLVLPSYDHCDNEADTIKAAKRGGDWIAVTSPQAFDVMVMLTPVAGFGVAPLHVGVMLSPRMVLHVDEGGRSECVPASARHIRTRFESYHRHKDLIERAAA